MNNAENEKNEDVPQVEHVDLHPTDADRLKEFLNQYLVPAALAIGIAAVILGGIAWYRGHIRAGEERATELLTVARSSSQLEEIISQYPSSIAAQIALLSLAKSYYDAGNYEQASAKYTEFETKYPKHMMADAARLGKLNCMEAMGMTEAALTGYAGFVSTHRNSFLVPVALFDQGRTLERLGRMDEARTIYEDFIAAHPNSPRISEAETALASVKRKMKLAASSAAAPPVTAPASSKP